MKLFVILALVAFAIADEDHGSHATHLKEKTFEDAVAKDPHFVMFFAPWCGHCKRLAPIWDQLAKDYNGNKDVVIAKVDCTEETSLCSSQDVTGYPTLKFFKDGVEGGIKHRGQRDQSSLERFIDEQMGRAPSKEEEMAAEPEEAVADNGLYVLTEKSFKGHIAKAETFVKFYAPWCGHCKSLAPTWDELAQKVDADNGIKATIAKVDCTKHQSICQENEVRGYPTLAYFKNGEKVESYSGARNLKELTDYVRSMSNSPKADTKEPTEDAKDNVEVLNSDSFKDVVAKGVTFVKFFAPWCGHCKRLAPIWSQLADKFTDNDAVTIAKVDCTSNDNKNKGLCNEHGVNGFPTLNVYKDGEKVEEFNGKRTLEDLVTYVEKQLSKKDEL